MDDQFTNSRVHCSPSQVIHTPSLGSEGTVEAIFTGHLLLLMWRK